MGFSRKTRRSIRPLLASSATLLLGLTLLPSPCAAGSDAGKPLEETVHWVPSEGLAHPLFATAGREDVIEIHLSFGPPFYPGPDLAKKLERPLKVWRKWVADKPGGRQAHIVQKGHRRSVTVEIHGLESPAAAIEELLLTYLDHGLRASEVFLRLQRLEGQGSRSDPLPDPRMPAVQAYADETAFWQAAFDPEQPPPLSEDLVNELGILAFKGGDLFYEIRGIPMFFEDVRIVYGTPKVDFLEADGRSLRVAQVVRRNLRQTFPDAVSPTFIDTSGTPNRVSKMKREGRTGYSFAIRRETDVTPFVVQYPEGFRYREYELLTGIRNAVGELDLEPVIFWHRSSLYVINLWEPLPEAETAASAAN